jgi:hypothetical protein
MLKRRLSLHSRHDPSYLATSLKGTPHGWVQKSHHLCIGLRAIFQEGFLYLQANTQQLAEMKGPQQLGKAGRRGVQAKEKKRLCLWKT